MRRLKVVTFAPDYLPTVGGAEIGLHSLLRECVLATGHEFSVVVPTDDTSLARRDVIDGVVVVRYKRPRRSIRWYAPTVSALLASPRLVRSLTPDVVHLSYTLPTGPGGWLAARTQNVPYVVSLGGNDVFDPVYPPPKTLQRASRYLVRHAEQVRCWSTPVRRVMVEEWGVEPRRARVTPFGVDVDEFRPLEPSRRESVARRWSVGNRPVVFALQRLERRKGVDVLLDAARLLLDEDVDFELLIGGAGRESQRLRQRACELRLEPRVRFLGFVNDEDKRDLLGLSDLFVLPSRHEGQGITLAEAAASGTPSVSTLAGGTVDMVVHGKTGLLVEPENPGLLAAGVAAALSDPERLRSWGEAARALAVDRLSLKATSTEFVEAIETAAQG